MTQWEYKTVSSNMAMGLSIDEMNSIGRAGWELVNVVITNGFCIYFFKRPANSKKSK